MGTRRSFRSDFVRWLAKSWDSPLAAATGVADAVTASLFGCSPYGGSCGLEQSKTGCSPFMSLSDHCRMRNFISSPMCGVGGRGRLPPFSSGSVFCHDIHMVRLLARHAQTNVPPTVESGWTSWDLDISERRREGGPRSWVFVNRMSHAVRWLGALLSRRSTLRRTFNLSVRKMLHSFQTHTGASPYGFG